MTNTTEQILLTLGARNNASNIFNQVDKDAHSMASSILSAISNINSGLMNIGSVTDNVMQGLTGKSAMDNILGVSSKAETNKVLVKNMLDDTEKNFDSFYDNVDKVTDSSLISMQELMPALKAFKSATGAADKDVENVTDEIANFGAAVLAQTGSTDLAQQSMMDLSKGIKGAFASLDQYGITQDALERTGYWNGDENDVKGFMKAVQKVTGSTEELMETNQGLDAQIGKAFSRAGKKMGNEFLPVIKDIKKGFLELDDSFGGNLTASILAVSGGVEVMNQGLWNVSTTVNGVRDLADAFRSVKDGAGIAMDTIKNFRKGTETVTTASEIASILSDISPEMIQAAQSHAGGNFLKDNSSEYIQDMLDHQISSIDDTDYRTALLEKKYEDLDIKSNRLNDVSNKTGKNLEKSQSKGLFSKFFKNTEETVESAAGVGALAPEATAASAGVGETAVATTGLSASFTAMITPLLALSAVIAIMIPIAVALAAEALLGLKAIQMVFEALDFGDIDLGKDISGIKQLAEGLAWIGVAMGAMSFAGVMTGLAFITGGFLGMTTPLQIAVDALTDAADLLKEFNTVSIDNSVPSNIKNISESLTSVSAAMMALTGTTITTGFSNFVAWVFGFSSTTDALGQAKNDLIKASNAINELATGIEPLNEEDASKIQNVCDSLASVGDAIGALRSIRDGQNWDDIFGGLMAGLFGEGVDIQTALDNVKTDIQEAATALKDWELDEVPEGVGNKVKAVADTLSSLSESFEALRSLRDSVNWDDFVGGIFGGQDIQGALTSIKTELYYTATNLKGLEGLPTVSEGIGDKVKVITDTVSILGDAVTGLTNVPDMGDYDSANLSTAVTNIQNAATELNKLNESTFNGESANGILTSISNTIETLKTTLSGASGFSEPASNIGSQIVNGVKSGLSPLTSTVQGAINSATSTAASAGLTGGSKIGSSTTKGVKSTLQIKSTMETEVNYALSAMTSRTQEFYDAGAALGQAANEGFQSFDAINPGSPGNLAHVMMDEVGYILEAMKSKYSTAKHMAAGLGKTIYEGFGNPNLGLDMLSSNNNLTYEQVESLETVVSRAPEKVDNRPVTLIINEGAVTVDARNKTENEALSIMTLALECMDNITKIDVNGV